MNLCTFLLLALAFSTLQLSNGLTPTIDFVSLNSASQSSSTRISSLLGGATLYIRGSGLSSDPSATEVEIGSNSCPIQSSLTSAFQIACTVPSVTSAGSVAITVTINGIAANCQTDICIFNYSTAATPILEFITPIAVVPNSNIYFLAVPRVNSASSLTLNFNSTYCDFSAFATQTLSPNELEFIQCRVGSIAVGYYNAQLSAASQGLGYIGLPGYGGFSSQNNTYNLVVVPQITKLSFNSGPTSGSILTITGTGFSTSPEQNVVTYGNNSCYILASAYSYIQCILSLPVQPTASDLIAGDAGWTVRTYNTRLSLEQLMNATNATAIKEQKILTSELPYGNFTGVSEVVEGFFRAPVNGTYRFYLSSGGASQLYMSKKALSNTDLTLMAEIKNASEFRNFFNPSEPAQASEPIYLREGQYYYMKAVHVDATEEHLTIGVKVPTTARNILSPKKVVSINIQAEVEREEVVFKFVSSSQIVRILYISNGTILTSRNITYPSSANQVVAALADINLKSEVLSETYYASDGSIVNSASGAANVQYRIRFLSDRKSSSLPGLTNTNLGGFSAAPGNNPTDLVSGSYQLNILGTTVTLQFNETADSMQAAIDTALGQIFTTRVFAYGDCEEGCNYTIQFVGINAKVPNITVASNSLSGGRHDPYVAVDLIQETSSIYTFYNPIPSDMLFTVKTQSQILVKTSGLLGSCSDDCSFSLYNTTDFPTVVNYTLTDATLKVQLINAAAYTAQQLRVFFSGSQGLVSAFDKTTQTITVTLATNANKAPLIVAGTQYPIVGFPDNTLAGVDSSVAPMTVQPIILTVQAIRSGNTLIFAVTGTGFGISLTRMFGTVASIGGVTCAIQVLSNTQLRCVAQITSTSGPLVIQVNGITAVFPFVFGDPDIITSVGVSYDSVNDINILDIKGSNFGKNTTAIILNNDNGETDNCRVCDKSSQELQCSLRGLQPGNYTVFATTFVSPNTLLRSNRTFTIPFAIYDVSPKTGSELGGTVLTITGKGFSPILNQNQVSIGSQNIRCDVIEANATKIQCITKPNLIQYSSPEMVTAWYRLEFESECLGECFFDYQESSTPAITKVSPVTIQAGQELTLTGRNFTKKAEITIGNLPATILSVNSTVMVVRVPDVSASTNLGLEATDPTLGDYRISSSVLLNSSLVLSSVSPLSGSVAGTVITLAGSGFSITAEVKVGGLACTIISQTTQEIVCKTAAQSTGYVTVSQGTFSAITCSGCYHTSMNSETPIVSSISGLSNIAGTDMSIVISGKLLNLVDDIHVVLESDSSSLEATLTHTSENSISATFAKPFAGVYTLEIKLGNFYAEFARGVSNAVTLNFPVSSDVSATSISIGGGLPLTIQTGGIPDDTELIDINIAGLDCAITQVTSSSITCTIPPLVTALTQNLYKIAEEDMILTGTYFASNTKENASLAFDNNTASYFISYTSDCYFGIDVGAGLVAQVSGIEYFPQYKIDESRIQGAVFEGSDDGTTYTIISRIDENVYEGTNRIVFSDDARPTYRFIRYRKAASTSSCQIAELRVRGTIVSSLNVDNVDLVSIPNATISMNGITQQVPINLNYQLESTPLVTSISPKLGTSVGGTVVTITGENFSSKIADVEVTIDSTKCTVIRATTTQITCTTGALPAVADRTSRLTGAVEVFIAGKGGALSPGVTFLYAERWSDAATWGCDGLPVDGDSVQVPIGMNLLVDMSTPSLIAVVVEGGLYFEDTALNFEAEYIMVRNGVLQIGTEANPIESEITITLTGNRSSSTLPIFGDKVIGLYEGTIDIHGKVRTMTSTYLKETAPAGQNYVVLEDIGDLQAGDVIVISTTSTDYNQNEKRTITQINGDRVVFDDVLEYTHVSESVQIEAGEFNVKAIVILLTRNVVIQGNDDSDADKYGAQMLFYDPGTEATVVRISYVEIQRAGQAGLEERYAINFQNTGGQVNSYIEGVSIHDTYNNALHVRGADYLTIKNNVFYNIEGTGIGLSDGVERFNTIEDNSVIGVYSNLKEYNADLSPAAILITNPLNYLRRNKVAGVVRTAFKLNYVPNAKGAFSSTSICPQGERLGAFEDNLAVSCGSYCLLSASHFPRKYACKNAISTSSKNPLESNPPVTAVYKNFSAARSQDAAIGAQDLGSVVFEGFKTGDNVRAGIEIKGTGSFLNASSVQNALLLGKLGLSDGGVSNPNYVGLIVQNAEGFSVENSSFVNFGAGQAAISSPDCGTDSSARTTFLKDLSFENVKTRIGFITPYTHIFRDLDGSLTDLEEGGTVVYDFPHLDDKKCVTNQYMQDGLVCDSSIQVKRVLLYGSIGSPSVYFRSMRISKINADQTNSAASVITPLSGAWGVPFITGKAYQLYINNYDWTQMRLQPSLYHQVTDLPITLVFNYTTYREDFDVIRKVYLGSAQNLTNSTTLWDIHNPETAVPSLGQFYNDVENKKLYLGVGRINTQEPVTYQEAQALQISAFGCKLNCPKPVTNPSGSEEIDTVYYWSEAKKWPSKQIPQDGDSVTIPANTRVILDVDTAALEQLEIQGELEFDSSIKEGVTLTAKKVWVRGKMYAGTKDTPYAGTATIKLIGTNQDSTLVVNFAVDAGTKVIAVTGKLELYGKPVETMLRLAKSASPNDLTITVDGDVSGLQVGDELYLAASRNQISESEIVNVSGINGNVITLTQELEYFHYGSDEVQKTSVRDVDMRTEVIHLNRNIRIIGEDNNNGLGAKIIVTEEFGETDIQTGSANLQYVTIESGGNQDSAVGALNFEVANNGAKTSVIKGMVIRDSLSYGIRFLQAQSVEIIENAIINVQQYGIILSSNNEDIQIENNFIGNINANSDGSVSKIGSISAGISLIDSSNTGIKILNNLASSCEHTCYLIIPPTCVESNFFLNNIAHSSSVGYLAYTSTSDCFSLSDFVAYKTDLGVAAYSRPLEIHASSLVLADNAFGLHIDTSLEAGSKIQISDSYFAAVIQSGCEDCYKSSSDCSGQKAIVLEATDAILKVIPSDTTYALEETNYFLSSSQFLSNNTFVNFQDNVLQSCGNNFIIGPNLQSSDYAPYIRINESTLVNVSQNYLVAFPTTTIVNSTYCDDLNCTNRYNILIKDLDGSFAGTAGTLLPNNPDVINTAACEFTKGMNGYICQTSKYGALTFEDLDKDACTTLLSPVAVSDNYDFMNEVNSYKKYISSDKQSCSAPRFTSIIQTDVSSSYTVEFTEYKPTNISFQLIGDDTDATTVTIAYKKPQVILVSDSNTQRTIDSIVKNPGETVEITSADSCGTNILDSTRGILSFRITGESSCKLLIQQANSLLFTIRFDIDVNEFFLQGGVAPFIDKVASVLGIASKNIRIVGIYRGSTILETAVLANAQGKENVTIAEAELKGYAAKLAKAVASNELMMYNATILNYSNQLLLIDREETMIESITASGKGGHGAGFWFLVIGLPLLSFGGLLFAIYQYKKARKNARAVIRVAPEPEKMFEKKQSITSLGTNTIEPTTEQVVVSSMDDIKDENMMTTTKQMETTEAQFETTGRQEDITSRQDDTIKELTKDIAGLSQQELIRRRQERYRRRFESPSGSLGSFSGLVTPDGSFSAKKLLVPKQIQVKPKEKSEIEDYIESRLNTAAAAVDNTKKKKNRRRPSVINDE